MSTLPIIASLGHEVTLVTTNFKKNGAHSLYIEQLRKNGITYIALESRNLPYSGSPMPSSLKKLNGIKFDLVYAIYGYIFQDIIGFMIAKKTKAALVYGCHSPSEYLDGVKRAYYINITKRFIRHANGAHVINNDEARTIASKNTFMVGYGVDTKSLSVIKSKRFGTKRLKIAFLGRLDDQKNIPRLIDIIELLQIENNIHFYVAGTGRYEQFVKEKSESLKNLTYVGFVKNEKLNEFYNDKHVFVNLSRYETYCRAILEAVMNGLIVIATNTAGIVRDRPELIFKTLALDYEDSELASAIRGLVNLAQTSPSTLEDTVKSNLEILTRMDDLSMTKQLMDRLTEVNAQK